MSNTADQKIRFIPDTEAINDAFGVHTQTANALGEIIISNITSTLRTVGLLGDWGSGKSTVIKFTQERLQQEDKDKFFFFTFDAWLHQGDAPRRSFLESLINKGCSEELLDEAIYNDDKQKLQGRIENHEIKTTPVFTVWGILIALSLLFLPLAARIYSNSPGNEFSNQNLLALFLTSLPALIALCNYLFWRDLKLLHKPTTIFSLLIILLAVGLWFIGFHRISAYVPDEYFKPLKIFVVVLLSGLSVFIFWKYNYKFCITHRGKYKDRSVAELFINKSTTHVTNRIVKTPDPTSIEFSSIFQNIIGGLGKKGRILVVIFDNLDRVEKNLALNMWAMIRSLLICNVVPSNENNSNYAKPFVIIPLDQTSIELLYNTNNKDGDGRSESFADKTFDVVLKLSPPIFSDWEEYLSQQITYAFGDSVTAQDYAAINKFFRFANEQRGHYLNKITPRKLNSVLNKIAAKLLLWGDSIPIGSICYYILFEKDVGENLENIKNLPLQHVLAENDSAWLENIASLYYGVDKAKAMQVYVEPQIIESIQAGDKESFTKISTTPGFVTSLEKFIEKNETIKTDARYVLMLSSFLNSLTLSNVDEVRVESMIVQLNSLFVSSGQWTYDATSSDGIRVFLDTKAVNIETILQLMALSLGGGVKNWVANFKALVAQLTPEEVEQVQSDLYVPGDAEQFIAILYEIMGEFSDSNKTLMQLFSPKAPKEEVTKSFLDFAENSDHYDEYSIWMLRLIRDITKPVIPLIPIFDKISGLLVQAATGDLKNANWALKSFITICYKDIKKSKEICAADYLFNLYYHLNNDSNEASTESKQIIMLLLMLFNPQLSGALTGNGPTGQSLITQHRNDGAFIESFVEFVQGIMVKSGHLEIFNILIDSAYGIKDWDKIISDLVSYKINKYNDLGRIYISLLTSRLNKILYYANDDTTRQKLTAYIATKNLFYENVLDIPDDNTAFTVFEMLDEYEPTQKTADAFYTYIIGKDSEWWDNAFDNADTATFPVNKLVTAQSRLQGKELGEEFLHGLEKYLASFKDSVEVNLPIEKDTWANILSYIDNNKRLVLLNNACDIIYDAPPKNSAALLALYFAQIKDLPRMESEADKFARRILAIMKSEDVTADELHLVENADLYKKIIESAEEATRSEIRTILVGWHTNAADNELENKLKTALNTLGFRLSPKKTRELDMEND